MSNDLPITPDERTITTGTRLGVEFWHRHRKGLETLEAGIQSLADAAEELGAVDEFMPGWVLRFARQQVTHYTEIIEQQLGGTVDEVTVRIPWPKLDGDKQAYATETLMQFWCFDCASFRLQHLVETQPAGAGREAVEIILDMFRSLPEWHVQLGRDHGSPHHLFSLAGWARSRLRRQDRLQRALEEEAWEHASPREMEAVFLQRLAGAAPLVVHEWDEETGLDELRLRFGRELTSGTDAAHEHPTVGLDPSFPAPIEDQFAVAQEAMRQLARDARLSPQESGIVNLMIEDPDISEQEISHRLGIAPGSVKSVRHRMRKKLRAAS